MLFGPGADCQNKTCGRRSKKNCTYLVSFFCILEHHPASPKLYYRFSTMPAHGTEIRIHGVEGRKGSAGTFLSGCESSRLGLALLRLDVIDPKSPNTPLLYFSGMDVEKSNIIPQVPSLWPDSVWDHLRSVE